MAAVAPFTGQAPVVHRLGRLAYDDAWRAMRDFTDARTHTTRDEIWLLEHAPVYTMGLKGGAQTATELHGIPLVHTDRGGDMTYHGPGQVVVYLLLDLRRRGMGAKELVRLLEQAVLGLLEEYDLAAQRRPGAPGVYVDEKKIAALGLRVRRGCSYHGLALNVDMDLAPFARIDPCGYPGLAVTRLADLGVRENTDTVGTKLCGRLRRHLGYNN